MTCATLPTVATRRARIGDLPALQAVYNYTTLYADLLHAVRPHATTAWAGIALPNPASVALHRKLGFVGRTLERDYAFKLGRRWDLGWFSLALAASPPWRSAPRPPRTG